MITLISKQNVEYLLGKFPNKFTKDNSLTEKSIDLLHYDMYASNHSNEIAYPSDEILLSVHIDCADLKEPFYRVMFIQNPKKRIIIQPLQEWDYENVHLWVYKLEVQELVAQDTTNGHSETAHLGTHGTSYSYLDNPSEKNPFAKWKGEKTYDYFLSHVWWNTEFKQQKLCKLKVGVVYNRKKGNFDEHFKK